jgi:hypothetical protein
MISYWVGTMGRVTWNGRYEYNGQCADLKAVSLLITLFSSSLRLRSRQGSISQSCFLYYVLAMRRRILRIWHSHISTPHFESRPLYLGRRVACAVCVALLDIESRCG